MAITLIDIVTGEEIWEVLYDGFDTDKIALMKFYFEKGKGDEGKRIFPGEIW